jgi:2-dehydro-3-deoxygluconokinase
MTTHPKKIKFAAIGECMLELKHRNKELCALSFAGDTFNVALYLARYQQQLNLQVNYVTALGDDPYSSMMLQGWQQEGIDVKLVQILHDKMPGLYLIRTQPNGERKFYYYRSQAAARFLFYGDKIKAICKQLLQFDYLYCSGISLAILDSASRKKLLNLLHEARTKNTAIVFDTNYRPRLWENKKTAQEIITRMLQQTDIALVTFSDEQQLFNDKNKEMTATRLHKLGVREVVIKMGDKGCFLSTPQGQQRLEAKKVKKVVDTTAAGDSFNAAYLGGRIKGLDPKVAAIAAQKLAIKVIGFRGAIIPASAMPNLFTRR